jgi:hypothetical protein
MYVHLMPALNCATTGPRTSLAISGLASCGWLTVPASSVASLWYFMMPNGASGNLPRPLPKRNCNQVARRIHHSILMHYEFSRGKIARRQQNGRRVRRILQVFKSAHPPELMKSPKLPWTRKKSILRAHKQFPTIDTQIFQNFPPFHHFLR